MKALFEEILAKLVVKITNVHSRSLLFSKLQKILLFKIIMQFGIHDEYTCCNF